ncbi:MAG TPA: FHA domain-containing protein [Aggregatilineales bacterium]|nr:FHA domain-containing protein [Aggregatilineales bacterium]
MSESDEKPVLIILEGEQTGQRWTIEGDEFVIGRGASCHMVLPERQVSREHLRIYRDGDVYILRDLDSKNGTWVNGEQVKNDIVPLRDGDEVSIALAVRMTYVASEATAPLMIEREAPSRGVLRLDRESRRVFVREAEVDPPLSLPQYRLLELLYDGEGRVCTRDEVINAVWPDAVGEGVSEQAIDALVRRLRDRLSENDGDTQFVVTVRGHGFRLNNPEP